MMYIYIIGPISGPYKIGYSNDPTVRLRTLQTGHNQELIIHKLFEVIPDNAKIIEKTIHKTLRSYRIRGEWFNCELSHIIDEINFIIIKWADDPDLIMKDKLGLIR